MSDVTDCMQGSAEGRGSNLDAWIRSLCALVVAGVAAYASYVHQREFALQGGADEVSASLWPLSVDGLLLLATVGLLKPSGAGTRRARGVPAGRAVPPALRHSAPDGALRRPNRRSRVQDRPPVRCHESTATSDREGRRSRRPQRSHCRGPVGCRNGTESAGPGGGESTGLACGP
ncbi:DUF2637 domain-containing protein [Streptomyces sp. 2A115]|uniref:DUF2637 domain-containing protein n=1 Tax=Streptomyces sp. 2A115 TaxID=3457439 RepID=UPI003FCF62CB